MWNIPKSLFIDCDGVLTDGTVTINHRGEKLFKQFHSRDIRAIRELVSLGVYVAIVTADGWKGGSFFADKVGADFIVSRDKNNIAQAFADYYAIGDDAWDVPMLKGAKQAFCPHDADMSALEIPGIHRLETCGGRGVIAELIRGLV